jgi:hypothetical protein
MQRPSHFITKKLSGIQNLVMIVFCFEFAMANILFPNNFRDLELHREREVHGLRLVEEGHQDAGEHRHHRANDANMVRQ